MDVSLPTSTAPASSDRPSLTATPITDAIDHIATLPENEAQIGLLAKGRDVGVQGSASIDLGKPGGWSFGAAGQWMRRQGAAVAAALTWKGRQR